MREWKRLQIVDAGVCSGDNMLRTRSDGLRLGDKPDSDVLGCVM